jgi:hypothetical protein
MMKSLRISFAMVVLMVLTAACDSPFEARDHLYDGPDVVEFRPVVATGSFTDQVDVPAGAEAPVTSSVQVQYISATPPDSPVTGEISILPSSTASEGQHVRFPEGRSWNIPAGGAFVDVPVELLPVALADGQSVTLVLELQDGTGYRASPNHRQFTFILTKAAS